MDERHRDRSFADGRRDALDVAAAHVADGEDAGQAGLEQVRRAGERPSRRREIVRVRSGPVLMKPFASSATQPSSQCVFGTAPVITKTCLMSCGLDRAGLVVPPAHAARGVRRLRARRSRSACAARLSGSPRCGESDSATSISASPRERTSMWTRSAVCARNTAAWPAELPPPTTMTSSPPHSCASMNVAP